MIKKLFYLFFPLVLGSIVGILVNGSIDYNTLVKPPLSPPGIIFPIMWSILYLLMGISYYIYRKYNNDNLIYYAQLFVNLLWTIIFFTLKLRLLGLIWIILLLVLIIIMYKRFNKYNKLSSYLLIPYIVWVVFATYLTIGINILN